MAFMEGNGYGVDHLFGLAGGFECVEGGYLEGKEDGACGFAWRITLDSNGDPTGNYHSMKYVNKNKNEHWRSLRGQMDYNESS